MLLNTPTASFIWREDKQTFFYLKGQADDKSTKTKKRKATAGKDEQANVGTPAVSKRIATDEMVDADTNVHIVVCFIFYTLLYSVLVQ